jgi:microsomal epoxide hydrolase
MDLNRLPNFIALVDGIRIHFLWFRSPHTHAVPLVMAHGWPSSCLEFVEAAQRLADPGAFGLATDIAFDVVLPSLPGYLFSEPGPPGTSRSQETARLWDGLMSALGYNRYVAHGDDLGGGVALRLGTDFPETVSAIHLGPYGAAGAVHLLAPDHPLAKVFNRDERRWSETEGAYEHEPWDATADALLVHGHAGDGIAALLGAHPSGEQRPGALGGPRRECSLLARRVW